MNARALGWLLVLAGVGVVLTMLEMAGRTPSPLIRMVVVAPAPTVSPSGPPHLTLLMSVFIANKPGRFDRYEIFKYTLRSYAAMNVTWDDLFFFVEMDGAYAAQHADLRPYLDSLFPGQHIVLTFRRFVTQDSWRPFMEELYGPATERRDRNVLFLQNDDHVFIDFDSTVLQEGLRLLEADPAPYKSLYWSHWPELIRVSGKLHTEERIGQSYVRFNATLLDAIQIFNLHYLWKILIETPWGGRPMTRIDGVALHRQIWPYAKEGDGISIVTENWQTVYVPLRELARHFDGYMHVGIPLDLVPALDIHRNPLEYSSHQSESTLLKRFTAAHNSQWTAQNDFVIPQAWMTTMLQLYKYIS